MKNNEKMNYEEKELKAPSGWAVLFITIVLYLAAIAAVIFFSSNIVEGEFNGYDVGMIVGIVWLCVGWFPFIGLRVIKPNEALVLTLFGKYIGTLRNEGFYFVNVFSVPVTPKKQSGLSGAKNGIPHTKISLKAMTHDNHKQKINDQMGNPIEVGIVVVWRVQNTAKALFNVDDYEDFMSIQADSTLRDVVRCYPYDSTDSDEMSLRGSSQEVCEKLKETLQKRVDNAGLEIIEARITHLAYAPEIAAAMLQRQQATAIIEARQKIVDGAVGMVEMALNKLSESNVCELDEERKAQMVSNLLVVLCGNKDAQPIVNSGSIY
ncbi:MAG: SPFH domain-containing protein [Oscillospiraceae bacterium]|nr:SPFH domain-containing protein [Oscillospiraceae bacterium]